MNDAILIFMEPSTTGICETASAGIGRGNTTRQRQAFTVESLTRLVIQKELQLHSNPDWRSIGASTCERIRLYKSKMGEGKTEGKKNP